MIVGTDAEAFRMIGHDYPDCDVRRIINADQKSLAAIGNYHITSSRQVFGIAHADTVFRAGSLESFCSIALNGSICGIVGRSMDGEYRWCHNNPGEVSTLDSCCVFFPRNSGLHFDEVTFDSFHCYAEDLCLEGRKRGMKVLVPKAAATHAPNFPSPVWVESYNIYRRRLSDKWAGVQFKTT